MTNELVVDNKLISEPGIYDIPPEVYHGQPCVEPSIGSSGLRMLLNECPAKYWFHSPLNPDRPPEESKVHFSIGKTANDLLLHGEEWFWGHNHVLGYETLQTKAAKAEKVEAEEAGKNVINKKQWAEIQAMTEAFAEHPFASAAFMSGRSEPSLFWQDRETGVWLRCRPDFLPSALRHIPDYKTAASAKPEDFKRSIYNYGYHMQAALYLDGIENVTGTKPQSFYFVVQEKEAPYIVTCQAVEQIAVDWGRIQNRKAIHLFAECLEKNEWPGYARDVIEVGLPFYAEMELQRQHEAGRFDVEEVA